MEVTEPTCPALPDRQSRGNSRDLEELSGSVTASPASRWASLGGVAVAVNGSYLEVLRIL